MYLQREECRMARFVFTIALTVGAMLVAGNVATAGDNVPAKSGLSNSPVKAATVTLGGQGTAAAAKAAPDSELAWYHGYYRGYRRGFYNGYYGGAVGYYPPVYPYGVSYYAPAYYPPAVGFYGRFGRVGVGFYPIAGNGSDASAPAVSLNLAASNAMAQRPYQPTPIQAPTPSTPSGVYRYDGGPLNPVPLPKQDPAGPNGQATPTLPWDAGLPVSLPKKPVTPAKPYTYKGYGEK
jgi:hypothetical protein